MTDVITFWGRSVAETAQAFRDSGLRYRLLPQYPDWQLSHDGTLEFRNLPENGYTLEVGYAGEGVSAGAAIGSGVPSNM